MMDMKNFFFFKMRMVLFVALLLFAPGAQTATAADVLVVGVSDDIPPMVFRDRGAELIGYDVDLLNEIGKRINKKIEFKVISWDQKEQELANQSIDVIASQLSVTEERKKILRYTQPVMQNFQAIIVPAASPIQNKKDLEGKSVCTLAGAFVIDKIHKLPGQKIQVKTADGNEQCLVKLLAGEVDASVLDGVPGIYYANNNPGAFRILPENFGKDEYAYGMRISDATLAEDFNRALAAIKADGTMQAIRERWLGKK